MTQTYSQIDNQLKKLFESNLNHSGFIFNGTSNSILTPISSENVGHHAINPLTGKIYDGIFMIGEWASINVLNNNNRKYFKANYIELLTMLRNQIHSIGVYGELEHPKQYASDYNRSSHKLIDCWYDEEKDKVMGIILILNTPKGQIAQEIVKSGGKLALSARGGGDEVTNADGTISATLRLLVTFDIVAHPGFNSALQNFAGFGENIDVKLFYPKGKTINIEGNENTKQLFESTDLMLLQQDQQSQETEETESQIMEKGQSAQQDEIQNNLQRAVDQDLSEKQKLFESFDVSKQKHEKINGLFRANHSLDHGDLDAIKGMDNTFSADLSEDEDFDNLMNESQEQFHSLLEQKH